MLAVMPLFAMIGELTFVVLYIVPNALALLYLYKRLPETRGREIHQIIAELMRKTEGDQQTIL